MFLDGAREARLRGSKQFSSRSEPKVVVPSPGVGRLRQSNPGQNVCAIAQDKTRELTTKTRRWPRRYGQ